MEEFMSIPMFLWNLVKMHRMKIFRILPDLKRLRKAIPDPRGASYDIITRKITFGWPPYLAYFQSDEYQQLREDTLREMENDDLYKNVH